MKKDTQDKLLEKINTLQDKYDTLKAKKDSLDLAQEVGHFGSWEIDMTTGKSSWSAYSYKIYKIDPKTETTLDLFISMVEPEDKQMVSNMIDKLKDGRSVYGEVKIKRNDGKSIAIFINAVPIFNSENRVIKIVGTTIDTTQRNKLISKNRELATIIEHSCNEIYIIDEKTYKYSYANDRALKRLGYTIKEIQNMTIFDINTTMKKTKLDKMKFDLDTYGSTATRSIHIKKDGSTYPVQSYVQRIKNANKSILKGSLVIFDIDITDLIASEKKANEQVQILQQIHDSVITTDLNNIITHWNNGATLMHGYTADEMIGTNIEKLYRKEDIEKASMMRYMTMQNDNHSGEIMKIRKDKKIIYTKISLSVIKNNHGEIIGIIRYSLDITQRKETEMILAKQTELLNFQAYHDPLTDLPNRALFSDRLKQSIANAHKHHKKFALLFIDLDNFKQINDTLGHHYGDKVLKFISKKLTACLEEGDTLSRFGGDEFTVIIQEIKNINAVAHIAQKILDEIKSKIIIDNREFHATASIGISLYPQDSNSKEDLIRYADTAMYRAKDLHGDNYQYYSSEMTRVAKEKAALEFGIRSAIDNNEFAVYYQPQVNSKTNQIIGLEALVRWIRPNGEIVAPGIFINLAEELGLINKIDSFVMEESIRDVKKWHDMGLDIGILSINISIKQLMDKNFLTFLEDTIADTGVSSSYIKLELTESQIMNNPEKSIKILNEISDMGIKISIDDFGTGYSSLSYLKRLPVDELKIDQSFIKNLVNDANDRIIIETIIILAENFNLDIMVEGVETKEQLDYLTKKKCNRIQGYYYSKPISFQEIVTFVGDRKIYPLSRVNDT